MQDATMQWLYEPEEDVEFNMKALKLLSPSTSFSDVVWGIDP